MLLKRMEECVDGEYQTFKSKDGAYVRKHFFGKYPELLEMVADMSDDDIWRLNRGGHDPHKVYAAYAAAMKHTGQPTVILAKTIKGYGMGEAGEGAEHHAPAEEDGHLVDQGVSRSLRDAGAGRQARGSAVSNARRRLARDEVPARAARGAGRLSAGAPAQGGSRSKCRRCRRSRRCSKASGDGREISTTMAFVRILTTLVRDKKIGKFVVPIVPDESRTFGMEGMFRQLGIYSHVGQLYTPQDADQLMFYKEDKNGQILQEGINEPGAMSSWIAAATSYSTHGMSMIPFYIFYSMFGFQRVGDLAWAAGDMRARGFLLGGTAGRTTLNGEGLQHEDGHSHLLASTIPNCVSYDPTFAYELAVIIQDGLRRMYQEQEDVYYYITVMNENYAHPAMPEGVEKGILKGMYLLREGKAKKNAPQGAAARQRHDPARSDRRRRAARKGFRHRGRYLERDELQRTAPRRPRRAALEHAASRKRSRACRYVETLPQGPRRAGHRGDRLHEDVRRPDARLPADASFHRARHRWLRPLGHARKAAPVLRSRSPLRRGRGDEGARRHGSACRARRSPKRSRSTASIRKSPIRRRYDNNRWVFSAD